MRREGEWREKMKYWRCKKDIGKNLGGVLRTSEDDVVSDTGMGEVGGCVLDMYKETSWEEVVEVLKCLRRGKAPGPDGILIRW